MKHLAQTIQASRGSRGYRAVLTTALALLAVEPAGAAEPQSFFAYRSFWPEFEAMRQFKDAGVNTVCIFAANTDNSLGQPYSKYPPVWRWFGKYDFDSLNKQYDDVLAVNPDAEFICMIDLNTPIWLQRQLALRGHSAECESFTMLSCACANPAWRKATGEYLEAVVKHMEARYGDRVKAYLLACGQTDEWMDYSRGVAGRAKTQAWKAWLQAHGKAEVPVPALERLDRASFDNLIRDPATEQDVVDYAQFTGDLIADTVLEFAAKTRALIPEAAPDRDVLRVHPRIDRLAHGLGGAPGVRAALPFAGHRLLHQPRHLRRPADGRRQRLHGAQRHAPCSTTRAFCTRSTTARRPTTSSWTSSCRSAGWCPGRIRRRRMPD